jgi:hypothetical protein
MLAMSGYSGTPLHRKLGIQPGHRVLVSAVPSGWDLSQLDPAGEATVQTRASTTPYDVVLSFCADRAALDRQLPRLLPRLEPTGRLWVCWPKRASGLAVDLDDTTVRELGLGTGLVDVKVCAVDETWSGLCFMFRLRHRT